jgi:hypothetical protein
MLTSTQASTELERLVGTWRTRGEVVGADGATAAGIEGTDSYELLSPDVVVHRADVRLGAERVKVLEVLGPFDPIRGVYPSRSYDADGRVSESTARVDARGVWRFSLHDAKATLWIGADGRTMRAEWLRSDDGRITWRPWMHVRFTRVDAERTAS